MTEDKDFALQKLISINSQWRSVVKAVEHSFDDVREQARALDIHTELLDTDVFSLQTDEVVDWTLKTKKWHSVAGNVLATEFVGQQEQLKKFVKLITLNEVLIDLSDSFGDYAGARNIDVSRSIYTFHSKVFTTESLVNPISDYPEYGHAHALGDLFLWIGRRIRDDLKNISQSKETISKLHAIIEDYGWCVSIMHIKDARLREVEAAHYLGISESVHGRIRESWIPELLWYNAQGSPVGMGAVVYETLRFKKDLDSVALNALYTLYEQTIPLIHVWLDDIGDVEEDRVHNDFNLFCEAQAGKIPGYLDALEFSHAMGQSLVNKFQTFQPVAKAHGMHYAAHWRLMLTMLSVYADKLIEKGPTDMTEPAKQNIKVLMEYVQSVR